MSSEEAVVNRTKQKARRRQSSDDDSVSAPSLAGAAPSSSADTSDLTIVPRRSTRIKNRTDHFTLRDPSPFSPAESDDNPPHPLDQIDCVTAADLGLPETHPASRLRVVIHPVAMALSSFHAHLSRTEVIGYLGGAVRYSDDGVEVFIAEAFPAQGLSDRVLARSGRNAFAEVEIDPESSVEVMNRLFQKNLNVVGWYHSHPDARFTVEPSRVDIANQSNYQQLLFKDAPFVGAIVAPYNEDLPDHNPDVQFFSVHEEKTPLKLPFSVGALGLTGLEGYSYTNFQRFPLDEFIVEGLKLVSSYCHLAKRVRLDRDWREGVLGLEKLRLTLNSIANEMGTNCEEIQNIKQQYLNSVRIVMDEADQRWVETGKKDDEKRERNKQANKKKKRTRR